MQSGSDKPQNKTTTIQDLPAKDIILRSIFSFSPISLAVMSAVSTEWNALLKNKAFWRQILVRDFGFSLTSIALVEPKDLKKIYIRLANLEKYNPEFATWYRKNIIETGADFSILYATTTNIQPDQSQELNEVFNLALKVNNLELAKQLMFVMFANDDDMMGPDYDHLTDMAEFGNLNAVNWLEEMLSLASESDLDDEFDDVSQNKTSLSSETETLGELSELSELKSDEQDSERVAHTTTLLAHALESASLPLIKSVLKKSSPEQILKICNYINDEDDDPNLTGLWTHGAEVAKPLISGAILAMKNAGTSIEAARNILYPIAAFSGASETFTWLEKQLAEHHFESRPNESEVSYIDATLFVAIATGKVDLVEWLLNPQGGNFDTKDTDVFDSINIHVAIGSRNPNMVLWFIDEKRANIKINTAEELLGRLKSVVPFSEMTIILESLLDASKKRTLPALTNDQLIEVLYTAANYGNVPAVIHLLNSNIQLTAENQATLIDRCMQSQSVPLLAALTAEERGAQRIVLDPTFISRAIRQLQPIRDDQNNLPALVLWLTDNKHGNLHVSESDIKNIRDIPTVSHNTKTLVEGILQRAFTAQNRLEIESGSEPTNRQIPL
jgi:hypothetical protein